MLIYVTAGLPNTSYYRNAASDILSCILKPDLERPVYNQEKTWQRSPFVRFPCIGLLVSVKGRQWMYQTMVRVILIPVTHCSPSPMIQSFGREYLAVKILTAEVTRYHYEGYTREAHFLDLIKRAQECQGTHGLPVYCEQFEISGPDGPHICLVMHIIGNSLSALRKQAPYKALPVHLVRSIVSQLVNSVAKLHNIGIMHTGTYLYVTQ